MLLTAYADTDVAIKAINDIGLDYYLLKPWDPPEERLYPGGRRPARRLAAAPIRSRPRPPRGRPSLVRAQPRDQDVPRPQPRPVPLVRRRARRGGRSGCASLADASPTTCRWCWSRAANAALPHRRSISPARSGLQHHRQQPLYDVCIVGGGPAGLAAAVYARVGGLEHGRGRARGARRAGRAERGDRELPRLPQGPDRRRPDPAGGRPGRAVRRRDGAGPRRRRASRSRGPVRAVLLRRGRGDRGAGRDRGHRRVLPPARGAGHRRARRARRLLRRDRQRGRASARATTSTSSAPPTRPVRPR